jgi:hypothetical protein
MSPDFLAEILDAELVTPPIALVSVAVVVEGAPEGVVDETGAQPRV